MRKRANYTIPPALLEVAYIAMQINLAKEASQIEPGMQTAFVEWVA